VGVDATTCSQTRASRAVERHGVLSWRRLQPHGVERHGLARARRDGDGEPADEWNTTRRAWRGRVTGTINDDIRRARRTTTSMRCDQLVGDWQTGDNRRARSPPVAFLLMQPARRSIVVDEVRACKRFLVEERSKTTRCARWRARW
jgi:hypothetical protein